MASLNSHNLIGNLGQDAEVKVSQSGTTFVTFSVATKEWVPNGEPETEWFNVSVFGRQAETLIDLIQNNGALKKGDQVHVQGPVRLNKFTKNDGTVDANLRVTARDVALLGSRRDAQQQPQQQYQTQPAYAQQYAPQPPQQGGFAPQQMPPMPPRQGYGNS